MKGYFQMPLNDEEDERLAVLTDYLEEQRKISHVSKDFRLHFVFESLRIALGEAEETLDVDLDWIWETLYEETSSKAKTAEENYILGLFIYGLVFHGSKNKPAFEAVGKWTTYSKTKCRDAFFEIQRIAKAEDIGFWLKFDDIGKKELINFMHKWLSIRNFSTENKKTMQAFKDLKVALENDPKSEKSLSTGVSGIIAQYKSNKNISA